MCTPTSVDFFLFHLFFFSLFLSFSFSFLLFFSHCAQGHYCIFFLCPFAPRFPHPLIPSYFSSGFLFHPSQQHHCDDTPTAPPPIRQPLRTISLLGWWSTSGPDGGIAHFFTATRNTIERAGEKEQMNETNNTSLGLTQSARQGVM